MEKIARICWNTHDWKPPSGREGKTENKDAYEVIVGFPSTSCASKLYIIGAEAPNSKGKECIRKLRDTYIAIWFRWHSFEDNKLSDEI